MVLSVRELPIGVLSEDMEHICGCPVLECIWITEWNGESNVCPSVVSVF